MQSIRDNVQLSIKYSRNCAKKRFKSILLRPRSAEYENTSKRFRYQFRVYANHCETVTVTVASRAACGAARGHHCLHMSVNKIGLLDEAYDI